MQNYLREAKVTLRQALKSATDEKLCHMLAWAKDGKMVWSDPCGCFASALSTKGSLHSRRTFPCSDHGPRNDRADHAYCALNRLGHPRFDARRMRRVIPIIKAEIRLRERQAAQPLAIEELLEV